jgi:TonB family protein
MNKYYIQIFKGVPILLTVLMLHVLVLWQVLQLAPAKTVTQSPKPITVSLIKPPPPLPNKQISPLPLIRASIPQRTKQTQWIPKPKKIKKVTIPKSRQVNNVRKSKRKPPKSVAKKFQKSQPVKKVLKSKRKSSKLVAKKSNSNKPNTVTTTSTQKHVATQIPVVAKQSTVPTRINQIVSKQTIQQSREKSAKQRKKNLGKGKTRKQVTKPPSYKAAYLHNPLPLYPKRSKRRGEEGTVWLRVKVSQQGRAAVVKIKNSSGFTRLDKAAHRTVQKWHFVPAQRAGKLVSAWVIVPIVFKLK